MTSSILVFTLVSVLGGTASGARLQNRVSAVELLNVTSMADRVLEAVGAKCCCDKPKSAFGLETVTSGAKNIAGSVAGKTADAVGAYVPYVDVSSGNIKRGHAPTGRCVVVENTDLPKKNKFTGTGGGCGSLPKSFHEDWTFNTLHDYKKTGGSCEVAASDLEGLKLTYGATLSCLRHGIVVACVRTCTGTAMEGADLMEGKEGERVSVSCPPSYSAAVETVKCGNDGKFTPRPKCVRG